jgi:hypothetical protein
MAERGGAAPGMDQRLQLFDLGFCPALVLWFGRDRPDCFNLA